MNRFVHATLLCLLCAAFGHVPLTASAASAPAPAAAIHDGSLQAPAQVVQGQAIEVSYATSAPSASNWIGLYTDPGNGPADGEYKGPSLKWKYAPGASGTVQLPTGGLEPGRYLLFFLANDGYASLAAPLGFDLIPDGPSSFVTERIETRAARVGEAYEHRIAALVRPVRPGLVFRKLQGPRWASVSADGVVSGTPGKRDAGTAHVVVRATGADTDTVATVIVPVRKPGQPLVDRLDVMSYNLWYGGTRVKDYRTKQLRFLLEQGVDVAGLQETYSVSARELAEALGWHHYQASYSLGIISKYPIVATDASHTDGTMYGAGARIRLDERLGQDIVLWTSHLHYTPYGPYDACHDGMPVDRILRREHQSGRPQQIADILIRMMPDLEDADRTPVFLLGDFNTPSHLDWVPAAADRHCGYSIQWPTTVLVAEAGLQDSFRVAHPDPAATPGDTWSPVYPEDPQDRIDFVHYKGDGVDVVDSMHLVVGTPAPAPGHADNAWTSDHAAVMTRFRLRSPHTVNQPKPPRGRATPRR